MTGVSTSPASLAYGAVFPCSAGYARQFLRGDDIADRRGEVIRRRWLTLMTHIPLLLLMGVMITAPANNFERHMLPVAFVFGFVVLTYWRESLAERQRQSATLH